MGRDTITTDQGIITDHGITGTGTAVVIGVTGIIGTDPTNVSDDGKLRLT
jgi:hypothetical protein